MEVRMPVSRRNSMPHFASSLIPNSGADQILRTQLLIRLIACTTSSESASAAMDKNLKDNKESDELLRERCSKEACEVGGNRRFSDHILLHILNLYGSTATARDFGCAHGVKQIKSAFYGLSQILIDDKQFYKCLDKGIDLPPLITLYVEDGKVVRHEDWWNKNPIWN